MTRRRLSLAFQVHPRLLGGQEQFLLRLLSEFRARGHRCLVVSSPSGRVLTAFERAGFHSLRLSGRHFGADRLRLVRALSERRVDLAQTNLYSPLMGLSAEAAGTPHVWRIGGHPDVALGGQTSTQRDALLQLMTSLSAATVCNSRYVAARLADLRARRPTVIHNGVPAPPQAPPFRTTTWTHRANISMVAHYYPQKQHQDFVRAVSFVHRHEPLARFRIYGSAFSQPSMIQYRDSVRALADRLGLSHALSYRSTSSSSPALLWSDVVVLPSLDESCSNAVLEAMAAGRAVVATQSGGNSELVTDGRSGRLFTPGDWRELAARLLELIREPDLRRRLGRKAARRVLARHSMSRCADAYEEVYSRLLG